MYIMTQVQDHIFEIKLNRPEKYNAIHWPMFEALGTAIEEAGKTSGVRVVFISGEGRMFSAGIDLMAIPEMGRHFGENWRQRSLNITAAYQAILNKVERCPVPTIALLHGFALGLGFELALACDFRIVARHTQIGLPEARLGLIPDAGGTTRLTRLVGPARAKELIMTGQMINLEQAERWGIVNAVVPVKKLFERGQMLAAEIAKSAPLAVSYAKRVIDGMTDIDRGLQLEAWAMHHLIQSEDAMLGVEARLAKREPEWVGK